MITICLSVFNKSKTLRNTLDSVLRQTNQNFHLVISDNASTDGCQDIIESKFNAELNCTFEIYLHDKNRGGLWNLTFLMSKIRTPYFFFFDAEDILSANYIAEFYECVVTRPDIVVPKFFELGLNGERRIMPAIDYLKGIGRDYFLSAMVLQSNILGVGYFFYSIFKYEFASEIFFKVFRDSMASPTKSQCEDMVVTYALLAKKPNIVFGNEMELSHLSQLVVDRSRKMINQRSIAELVYPNSDEMDVDLIAKLGSARLLSPEHVGIFENLLKHKKAVIKLSLQLAKP